MIRTLTYSMPKIILERVTMFDLPPNNRGITSKHVFMGSWVSDDNDQLVFMITDHAHDRGVSSNHVTVHVIHDRDFGG